MSHKSLQDQCYYDDAYFTDKETEARAITQPVKWQTYYEPS